MPANLTESGMLSNVETTHLLQPQYEQPNSKIIHNQSHIHSNREIIDTINRMTNQGKGKTKFAKNSNQNKVKISPRYNNENFKPAKLLSINDHVIEPIVTSHNRFRNKRFSTLNSSYQRVRFEQLNYLSQNSLNQTQKINSYQQSYQNKIQGLKARIQHLRQERQVSQSIQFQKSLQRNIEMSQDLETTSNHSFKKRAIVTSNVNRYFKKKQTIKLNSKLSNSHQQLKEDTSHKKIRQDTSLNEESGEQQFQQNEKNINFLQDLYSDLSERKKKTALIKPSQNQYRTIFKKRKMNPFEEYRQSVQGNRSINSTKQDNIDDSNKKIKPDLEYLERVKSKIMGSPLKSQQKNNLLLSRNKQRMKQDMSQLTAFYQERDSIKSMQMKTTDQFANRQKSILHQQGMSFNAQLTKQDIMTTLSENSNSFRQSLEQAQFLHPQSQQISRNMTAVHNNLNYLHDNEIQNVSNYRSLAVRRQRLILAQKQQARKSLYNYESVVIPLNNNFQAKSYESSPQKNLQLTWKSLNKLNEPQKQEEFGNSRYNNYIRDYHKYDLRKEIQVKEFHFKNNQNRSIEFKKEFSQLLENL